MKTLVATVALAAVIASPALAQSTRRAPVQQYQSQYDQPYGRFEGRPQAAPSGNGVRFFGGRQRMMLVMNTSSRLRPMATMMRVSSCPATLQRRP